MIYPQPYKKDCCGTGVLDQYFFILRSAQNVSRFSAALHHWHVLSWTRPMRYFYAAQPSTTGTRSAGPGRCAISKQLQCRPSPLARTQLDPAAALFLSSAVLHHWHALSWIRTRPVRYV